MNKEYKFIPKEYGFEPIENFPELSKASWYGSNTYIKIIENGGPSFGRKVFWYKACAISESVVSFYSHSFDASRSLEKNFELGNNPRVVYLGLISNHDFAVELLKHLFGTLRNDSVQTFGKERLERNINEEAKKQL